MERTKDLLFPINLKYWMKLGFVSLLSAKSSFVRGLGSSNFNIPQTRENAATITGNAISNLEKTNYGLFGGIFFIATILFIIWKYITSIFTFIFIEAAINKEFSIKQSWRKNKPSGSSFFLFRILTGLIFLIVSLLIFSPLIVKILQIGFTNYVQQTSSAAVWGTFFIYLILFLLWSLIFGVFMLFVNNFSLIDMYKNRINITSAIKNTFNQIRLQKLEIFIYVLASFLLSIGIAILAFLVLIIPIILFGLIGVGLFFLLFILSKVLAFILIILYVIFLVYLFVVILLPFTVFMRYFSILGYEKLFNAKIIKNYPRYR